MFSSKKKTIFLISASALLFILIINQVNSQTIKIVDGDTIHLNGEKIRFTGIDTPELKQTCLKEGIENPCGITAKKSLLIKLGIIKWNLLAKGKIDTKEHLQNVLLIMKAYQVI